MCACATLTVVEQLLSRELVGRADELATLGSAVSATAAGRGGGLALVGDGGIGKSRLSREAMRHARSLGLVVLEGRAVEGGTPAPFRPLSEALAAGFRTDGWPKDPTLLPLRPTLAHLNPEWSDNPAREPSLLAISEALLRLLDIAGRGRGAMLVVEDAHWADADTVAVLEYLIDNAEAHGTLCLLTLRPEPPSEALRVVRRLADRRVLRLEELAPLDDAAVDRLVLSCLGQEAVSSELLAFVRQRADGIPFFVEELLAGLVRSGALLASDDGWRVIGQRLVSTVPATLADSVARRFRDLHPRTQQVLLAAALLGRSFDWRLLPRVTDLDPDAVLASLREATYAMLLTGDADEIRFRHALTRDHVIALTLPFDRTRLAARAVRAVEEAHPRLPGEWCDLAAGLAEAARDAPRAVRHLIDAAGRARNRGALASAAARLERAYELARAEPELLLDVQEELAQVRALAGHIDDALDLGGGALRARRARGDAPGREVDLELALSRAALTAGRYESARGHADRACRDAVQLGDRRQHVRATAIAAQVSVAAGDSGEAMGLAHAALDSAGDDLPEVRCEALEVLGRCARLHDVAVAERAFEEALTIATRHGLAVWRARALHELGTIDLLETMRVDRLEEARRAAIEAGAPATVAVVDFHIAEALVARGEPISGREAVERAIALSRRLGSSILAPALVTLARSYAHERRVDEMEAAIARALAASGEDPLIMAGVWGRVRAMLALHLADAGDALECLDRATELLRAFPSHHFPYWSLWALLRTLADDDGNAARAEAARAPGSDNRYTHALLSTAEAVAAGQTGDGTTAAAGLERAIRALGAYEGSDWIVHLSRWLVAPAALADGWGEPVAWLQDAVRWFAAHGYEPLATACRTALRDAGAPVPRQGRGNSAVPDMLRARGVTSREVDVLTLVQQRLSNRQIAERLVLSPKTVEKHVASLLAKTGETDRAALAVLAASLQPATPDR